MNVRSFDTVVSSSGTVVLCLGLKPLLVVCNMKQRYLVDSHTINHEFIDFKIILLYKQLVSKNIILTLVH